ncbi:MAG TPA: hypothetical protein VF188_13935 [Longimicrobiales bacterium]
MSRPPLLLAAALAITVSAAARAQQAPDRCEILDGVLLSVTDRTMPDERIVLSGSVHIGCAGGVHLYADTAISESATGMRRFIGNVVYRDSMKTLTADRVDYFALEERLLARGDVVLTDRDAGSVIRGPELEYFRATEWRPRARMLARGRPHAILRDPDPPEPASDSATVPEPPADSTAAPEPFEVDADSMEIVGEENFRGSGNVVLVRGETRGFGDEALYDQAEERMILTGGARVEGEAFTLLAERIDAQLAGEELERVVARGMAQLVGEEIQVDAPALTVFFAEGEVQRMVAVRWLEPRTGDESAPPGPPLPQPRAVAETFWMTADSIDALAPDQRLDMVIAVGDAYGERIDTVAADVPDLVAHDWLRGDTITATFVAAPDSVPADSAAQDVVDPPVGEEPVGETADAEPQRRVVLDRLVAVGEDGGARSLYRFREEGAEEGPPSVNYLVANRIELVMREGKIQAVHAEGALKGMNLQPGRPPATPPDSGAAGASKGAAAGG